MKCNTLITSHGSITARYVLTRRVEKLIPLARLTCIVMPHHEAKSILRHRKEVSAGDVIRNVANVSSDMRSWTAIKILKYGLEKKLFRKKGWLFDLLKKEGCTLRP
jgi:hypothetical protein